VADHRFGTPSLAAAAVVPNRAELEAGIERLWLAAGSALERRLAASASRLGAVDRERAVLAGLSVARGRLDRSGFAMDRVDPRRRVAAASQALVAIRRQLEALSPVRVLERGYAVVRDATGKVLRDATQVEPGAPISVQLAAGRVGATVQEVHHG
jgi:exodeoxyribonuclease VII large subunit